MTNSRSISRVAGIVTVTVLTLSGASFADDPLRPNAVTQLNVLQPPIVIPALRLGIFDFHPQLSAGVTYDDNIALSSTNKLADWIYTVSPHLSAVAGHLDEGIGTMLRLDYGPSFQIFNQHSENDSIDHHASLSLSRIGAKLSLGLAQRFDQTKSGVVETGQRLQQRQYETDLTSKYKVGEKTSVELNPRLTISETKGLIGNTEYGVDTFLNRQITAKITGSLGGSAGYIDVQDSPRQIYERALGRFKYAVTGKVDVDASAGGEWRQFGGGFGNRLTPVFGIGAAYRPFEKTAITLEASRRDEVSAALTNQDYTATGVTLGIQQGMWERFHLSLAGGYENRDYHASSAGTAAVRTDDVYLLRAGIGVNFGRHWVFDVYYQYNKDRSTDPGRRFTDNQVGIQGTWKL